MEKKTLDLTSAGNVENQLAGTSRPKSTVAVVCSRGEEHEIWSGLFIDETEPSGPMGWPPDHRGGY